MLPFFRQWYAMCLSPELEALCARVVPEEQQGFIKGRCIMAAVLSHYALIESARLNNEKLYVTYVDVKKAFPTVNRDLLFQKLSNVGASDRLVRALAGLYVEARGTVRGPDGYATPFDITIGTREGGVELAFNALHGSLWQMPCVRQLEQLTSQTASRLEQLEAGLTDSHAAKQKAEELRKKRERLQRHEPRRRGAHMAHWPRPIGFQLGLAHLPV